MSLPSFVIPIWLLKSPYLNSLAEGVLAEFMRLSNACQEADQAVITVNENALLS
jgi:hypothetical protein